MNPGIKVSTVTPYFLLHLLLIHKHIFHIAKKHFNSRSKIAHLSLKRGTVVFGIKHVAKFTLCKRVNFHFPAFSHNDHSTSK